jgi:small subunit ribosomal protein S5
MMADENNTSEEVVAVDASGAAPEGEARRGRGGRGRGEGGGRGRREDRKPREEKEDDGTIEKLVHINRVSKTVKGGKHSS